MSDVKLAWRALTAVSVVGFLALCTNAGTNKLTSPPFVRILVCIFQFLTAQS